MTKSPSEHEHLPPPGYVQALPVVTHGDRELPEGVAGMVLTHHPAIIRALNLIREDSGGPSWPPESEPVIAARWQPYLDRIEAAIGALADDKPAPEDDETNERLSAGEAFCYLDSELYTFVAGEHTAQTLIAARSEDLTIASHFLNDFFEGWSTFEDDEGFDPLRMPVQ
jgi:hypothetical protein